jgi:hypothetical protein
MLVVTQRGKVDNASAAIDDTSKILVMNIAGTAPRKVISPRATTFPLWMSLPKVSRLAFCSVGNIAKGGQLCQEGRGCNEGPSQRQRRCWKM